MKPDTSLHQLKGVTLLQIASQGGVQNGNSVQDEYKAEDMSYSRSASLWDDGE